MSAIVPDDLLKKINKSKIPNHVAVIMDGNGRWAKKIGKERFFGHNSGVNSVRDTIEASIDLGVKNLTLYANEDIKKVNFFKSLITSINYLIWGDV